METRLSRLPVVNVEDVIVTPELLQRVQRPPNLVEENHIFRKLADALSTEPGKFLDTLVNVALHLCQADTVGISVEETNDTGEKIFRWVAMAGILRHMVGGTTPREFSPCGICLDTGQPVLMEELDRAYPYFKDAPFPFVEALLVPWGGNSTGPAGTFWIVAHSDCRKFDLQDVRIMSGLAAFASGSINLLHRLQDGERMPAALNMTAAMAHHINNPLQGAMLALYRLKMETKLDMRTSELLDVVEQELARVVALSSELLRRDDLEFTFPDRKSPGRSRSISEAKSAD